VFKRALTTGSALEPREGNSITGDLNHLAARSRRCRRKIPGAEADWRRPSSGRKRPKAGV